MRIYAFIIGVILIAIAAIWLFATLAAFIGLGPLFVTIVVIGLILLYISKE